VSVVIIAVLMEFCIVVNVKQMQLNLIVFVLHLNTGKIQSVRCLALHCGRV